jgi:hypothetical protein
MWFYLDLVNFKFESEIMSNRVPLTTAMQNRLVVGGNYGTGRGGGCGGENQNKMLTYKWRIRNLAL